MMNEPTNPPPDLPAGQPPKDGSGLEKIAQKGRLEFRMVTEGQEITPDMRVRIIDDLKAYRDDNPLASGPLAWGKLAGLIGISSSCLSDILNDRYKGNRDEVLHKIDQFLADDRARVGRFDFRTTAKLSMTEAVFGVIRSAIRMNTMAVIIGSPGVGKSAHARAFAADRSGVVMIRADEKFSDASGVTALLCNAIDGLRPQYNSGPRKRLMEIKNWLRKHQSTVIVVDECQKLDRSGLEMLRDIHDISDPTTRRNVPVIFFGDQDFLKLIFKSRNGERSPISPQCIRRMRPVLNIDTDCRADDGGGLYTVEDIVQIVRNNRVKLLTSKACRWLRDLANVIEYGAIGNAMGVLQLAVDTVVGISGELDKPIDVPELEEALQSTFGRDVALHINELAHGTLLRTAASA